MNILALNAGSSSLKFSLVRREVGREEKLIAGAAKDVGQVFEACGASRRGERAPRRAWGARLLDPSLVTAEVLDEIRAAAAFAPLHNDAALAEIDAVMKRFGGAPAVAVFDTGFHRSIPDVAVRYALPRDVADRHVLRRYGFHGISHRYVSEKLLEHLRMPASGSRLITCHLGSGCSVCAVRDGKSVDTSMGIDIDLARNNAARGDAAQRISAEAGDVQIWVTPTDEETQIAREATAVLMSPRL